MAKNNNNAFAKKLGKTAEDLCDKKYAQRNFNSGRVTNLVGLPNKRR